MPLRTLEVGMTVDSSDFDRRFRRFMKVDSIKGARRGLGSAGKALMMDTLGEEPVAPEDTSALRASISVFVNRILVKTSEFARRPNPRLAALLAKWGQPGGFIARTNDTPAKRGEEYALMVVNAPYASVQETKWHKGYVMVKLIRFRDKYVRLIGRGIQRTMR